MPQYKYTVIGAGPAGIFAVLRLLQNEVPPDEILWTDKSDFKVGDFGTRWKNVPGNTTVKGYRKVNNEAFAALEKMINTVIPRFSLDSYSDDYYCHLSAAAKPIQCITDILRKIVPNIAGSANSIDEGPHGLEIKIAKGDEERTYYTERAVLAIGAEFKSLPLPSSFDDKKASPDLGFDVDQLKADFKRNPLKHHKIAIVGSSHSAYLAARSIFEAAEQANLPKDRLMVTMFVNKEASFAKTVTDQKGNTRIFNDNTGLKGSTAEIAQELIAKANAGKINLEFSRECASETTLTGFSKIFSCFGMEPRNTVKIMGVYSSVIEHDPYTTQVKIDGKPVPGVFAIGIGHPLKVQDISGEITNNVGVTKFWPDLSQRIFDIWKNNPAKNLAQLCWQGIKSISSHTFFSRHKVSHQINDQNGAANSDNIALAETIRAHL